MKIKISLLALALGLLFAAPLQAQRKVLAVGNVKINPSVETAAKAEGTLLPLQRVTEAIDGQLIDALNGTRKFEIIARSDLDSLLEEGGFTGEGLQVGGSDYLVVPAVDDFQDIVETFSANGRQATKRTIRLGMVARIYDSQSGKLIESANFQFNNREAKNILGSVQRKGEYSAALLRQIAEEMAEKCANRVVDVIYPARIIAVTGPQATINRGDGTGIESGQLWDAYALGEELIDPDTGESLGRTEVKVGTIRIDRVTPKFSTGTITENFGVSKGAVVRMAQ
ncbi:MAG: hypothetical protein GVY10_07010 [Verrucomicrobia bacterium]|jgi:curli biogenesis system outer membrane secretion channel CsgG|nr:hypothetical protein [Verrucomicrobiota bacterium]